MTKSDAKFNAKVRLEFPNVDGSPVAPVRNGPATAPVSDGSVAPVQALTYNVPLPGKLGNVSEGSMRLHTREALRVFSGRTANAKARAAPLPGGRHYAAALKSIWYLSGTDNPYADWMLIRAYDGLATLRARMAELTVAREAMLAELRRKGLLFEVLASASPVTVALGFRSPYGFAIAEAILEFDYYVRLVQTLVQKDRLSDLEGVTDIRALSQSLFALFHKALRWERLLLREELKSLSRADFRPDAGADAQRRVTAASALLGKLPRNILLGSEQPRHSRRRGAAAATDTIAELQLLAPLTVVDDFADATLDAADTAGIVQPDLHPPPAENVSRETGVAAAQPASTAS